MHRQRLEEYIKTINTGNAGVTDIEIEYRKEIIKRLRAYDRICRDLKELLARLSNGLD